MAGEIDLIVPVHNEEEGLRTFYHRIRDIPIKLNLIFVDNASTDKTLEILKTFDDITVIEHDTNEGYGASICDGIHNSKGEIIVIIDADCEYPPESIPLLVRTLEKSDVVYASRFLERSHADMPFLKMFGNKIISSTFNLLFAQKVTDLYTGCKALKRSVLKEINLNKKGFEHVLEMAVQLSRKGIAIHEISVKFTPRRTGHSKMNHLSETLKFLYLIFYYYFLSKIRVQLL